MKIRLRIDAILFSVAQTSLRVHFFHSEHSQGGDRICATFGIDHPGGPLGLNGTIFLKRLLDPHFVEHH